MPHKSVGNFEDKLFLFEGDFARYMDSLAALICVLSPYKEKIDQHFYLLFILRVSLRLS